MFQGREIGWGICRKADEVQFAQLFRPFLAKSSEELRRTTCMWEVIWHLWAGCCLKILRRCGQNFRPSWKFCDELGRNLVKGRPCKKLWVEIIFINVWSINYFVIPFVRLCGSYYPCFTFFSSGWRSAAECVQLVLSCHLVTRICTIIRHLSADGCSRCASW